MNFHLALVLAASFAGVLAGPSGSRPSWNALLGTENLFDDQIDGRSYVEGNEVSQLEEMLQEPVFLRQLYVKYVSLFNKVEERSVFTSGHEQVFKAKLLKIAAHNVAFRAGEKSYEMGVNQFTDLTEAEFLSRFTGLISLQSAFLNSSIPQMEQEPTLFTLQDDEPIDWRTKNVVGPVKNQGNCGSCVPFGITSTVESAQAKATGKSPLDLSEQQIVDCCKGNAGCNGGSFGPTLDYLKTNPLTTEKEYKYEAKQRSCRMRGKKAAATVKSFGNVDAESETDLQSKIAEYGPVAIAVHVSDDFANYKSGVFKGPCDGGRNHAVAAVGYGNKDGQDYWIVKNSWGTGWGDKGYILIEKGSENRCDVAGDAVYIVAQ